MFTAGDFVVIFNFAKKITEDEGRKIKQSFSPIPEFLQPEAPTYKRADLCEECQRELLVEALKKLLSDNKWDNILKEIF